MKKRIALRLGAASSILALALAGCSLMDTPKDEFVKAYDQLNNAKTLETKNVLSFDINGSTGDSEVDEMLSVLDGGKTNLTFNTTSDTEKKLTEVDLAATIDMGVGSTSLNLDLLLDENKAKIYTTESYLETATAMLMGASGDLLGSVDKGDKTSLIEIGDLTIAEENREMGSVEDFISQVVVAAEEDNFTKKDDVITAKIPGDKVKEEIVKNLKDGKEGLEKELDMSADEYIATFEDTIKIDDVVIKTTIKDDKVKEQVLEMPISIGEGAEKLSFVLNLDTEVKSINKKVDFSFDLDKAKVKTMDEYFEGIYQ